MAKINNEKKMIESLRKINKWIATHDNEEDVLDVVNMIGWATFTTEEAMEKGMISTINFFQRHEQGQSAKILKDIGFFDFLDNFEDEFK